MRHLAMRQNVWNIAQEEERLGTSALDLVEKRVGLELAREPHGRVADRRARAAAPAAALEARREAAARVALVEHNEQHVQRSESIAQLREVVHRCAPRRTVRRRRRPGGRSSARAVRSARHWYHAYVLSEHRAEQQLVHQRRQQCQLLQRERSLLLVQLH